MSLALFAVAFSLGMRHGFDADHLAVVEGFSRLNAARPWGRWSGFLFASGHGLVVMAATLVLGTLSPGFSLSSGWEDLGQWVSVFFLFLLGYLNLKAASSPEPALSGLKSKIFPRFFHARASPFKVTLTGAVFAFSFDTMTQVGLFLLSASHGGWPLALGLGAAFVLGMALVDGADGLWAASLARRGARASRALALGVGVLSLALGAVGMAQALFDFETGTVAMAASFLAVALLLVLTGWGIKSWLSAEKGG
mgnify:CR=1 FL=1